MNVPTLLLALAALAPAAHGMNWHTYARRMNRTLAEFNARDAVADDESTVYFTQRLDHFDRQELATFQQRSFQNDTFFDGTGPVFVCVGGEGPPLDPSVLISSVHCNDMVELAPSVGALMLAIEHRYYGKSIPTKGHGVESLKWLSSQQALGDIAEFHAQIVANYSLTDANKFVTFGGSYPGMMSGFARLKYPNLIHASISSSSPWQAQVDMPEYQDLVGNSLSLESVGGSDECKATVVNGHVTIGELILTTEGQQQLAEEFNFCSADALSNIDRAGMWAGNGVIYVPSQENDPSCTTPACDIASICEILADTDGDDVAKLAAVSAVQNDNCLTTESIDPEVTLALLKGEQGSGVGVANQMRSWPYQTCTEFGFYQTCEFDTECPFTQGYVNLSSQIAMCEALFRISPEQVYEQVDFTNAYYGGNQPAGSRIMFPNGNVDPWSGLGVLVSPDASTEPVYMAEGASHHFWTHPQDEIVQDTVKKCKKAVQDQVVVWLAED